MGALSILAESTPIIGQAYGFTRTAVKVYNSTSPIGAVGAAIEGIFVDCMPPNVKYPVKCAILVAQCGVAVVAASNPVTGTFSVALAIGSANSIVAEKLIV